MCGFGLYTIQFGTNDYVCVSVYVCVCVCVKIRACGEI